MLLSYADFHFLQLVFCSWTIKKEKDRVTVKDRNESITSLAHDAITILPLLEHGD
jgi:hypothetical protein